MIWSDTELQSAKKLVAELEAEVSELEKLEQADKFSTAINQRREHIASLKSEIETYDPDIPKLVRDEIDRDIIKDLRLAVVDWDKLRTLRPDNPEYSVLLDLTKKVAVHPEGYDGPCLCGECQSYGEQEDDDGSD